MRRGFVYYISWFKRNDSQAVAECSSTDLWKSSILANIFFWILSTHIPRVNNCLNLLPTYYLYPFSLTQVNPKSYSDQWQSEYGSTRQEMQNFHYTKWLLLGEIEEKIVTELILWD